MMANPEILYPAMRRRTREALKNLFFILDIEGRDFDEKLFELASTAFAANATAVKGHALIKRATSKQPRRQIDIKAETWYRLKDIHARLFPYLPWQSWNWYMEELIKIAERSLHEKKDDYDVLKVQEDEIDVYRRRKDVEEHPSKQKKSLEEKAEEMGIDLEYHLRED